MDKQEFKEILDIFDEHYIATASMYKKVVNKLKADCATYYEVKQKSLELQRNIIWEYGEAKHYHSYIDGIIETLEDENGNLELASCH